MGGKRKYTEIEVRAICAEYEAGASISAIAIKRGVSYELVRQILHCWTYKEIRRPVAVRPLGRKKAA